MLFALLVPAGYFAADVDPVQNAAFLADNQAIMYLWYLTIYVVYGQGDGSDAKQQVAPIYSEREEQDEL